MSCITRITAALVAGAALALGAIAAQITYADIGAVINEARSMPGRRHLLHAIAAALSPPSGTIVHERAMIPTPGRRRRALLRELLPGVIVAAVCWQLLQHLGGFCIDHTLKRTGPLYGVFALMLGLLAWLYIGAQLTIFAAGINVVKARRLWPRSFFADSLRDADRRTLVASAEIEERVPQENVEVDFDSTHQP